jgi:5-methylcytosine-specific restriction endonuclease McrA
MKRSPLKRSPFKTTRRRLKARVDSKLVAWSKAVRERDGYICQRCKGPGNHAHHVFTRSRRPDMKYNVDGGKTLCTICHLHVHNNPIESVRDGWLSDEKYEVRAA